MNNKKAFTLIELLVVIAIIGILATISVIALQNARVKSRDAKRVGDIKQIQTALELFFNDNNRYPTAEEWNTGQIYSTSTDATSTYMQIIPVASMPIDGACTSVENYFSYIQGGGGGYYAITFCLGGAVGSLSAGPKCLTPGGILDGQSNNLCNPIFSECTAANNVGDVCGGGVLYSTSSRLIASPSGCSDVNGANCDNTFEVTDTNRLPWDSSASPATTGAIDVDDGRINVQNIKSSNNGVLPGNIEAIKFCDDLVVNGFSDFYLPAYYELAALFSNSAPCVQCTVPGLCGCLNGSDVNPIVGGIPFPSLWNVWLSSESNSSVGQWFSYTGSFAGAAKSQNLFFRCIRRF